VLLQVSARAIDGGGSSGGGIVVDGLISNAFSIECESVISSVWGTNCVLRHQIFVSD